MNQTLKTILVAALVSFLVVVGFRLVVNQSAQPGMSFAEQLGAAVGITRLPNSGMAMRFLKITSSAGTATAGTDGTFSVGGGTEISILNKCVTATWNPGSLATSTITNSTSTDIALPGAVLGDTCVASLDSATSSALKPGCNISGTATGTISLMNIGTTNAAIDAATGTAKICYTH